MFENLGEEAFHSSIGYAVDLNHPEGGNAQNTNNNKFLPPLPSLPYLLLLLWLGRKFYIIISAHTILEGKTWVR